MSLQKSHGQMYPWVTNMHSHLRGACSHKCSYCYAADHEHRYSTGAFSGDIRLKEDEFKVRYGTGKTIFIEHMNDLFAVTVPRDIILRVIDHCMMWNENTFVFQSKNPARFNEFLFPDNCIFGTTIETNRWYPEHMGKGNAPTTEARFRAMSNLMMRGRKFVTIEPVMDFDVDILAGWIADIHPDFLNLGADSKNHHLPEPTVEKIMALVAKLHECGIELREKSNLQRLKP